MRKEAPKRDGIEHAEPEVQAALQDLARSLHASYLQRWGRHDPAGLERAATRGLKDGSTAA